MFKLPSPIQEVQNHHFGFPLFVKREDLIHPVISGNKYRKLKYNLLEFEKTGYHGIISFGGVFSNHLHALAGVSELYHIPAVAILRGEDDPSNPTLAYLREKGMTLHFTSREAYRHKEMNTGIADILTQYPNYFLIPEGGSNVHALPGVIEITSEIANQMADVSHIAVAAGTAYTAAGLLMGLRQYNITAQLMVFSALKGDFLVNVISDLSGITSNDFYFTDEWSLGGYAKVNQNYLQFLADFEHRTCMPVDPVYNGKLLYGLYHLGQRGYFKPTDKILWIDTGGIQGKAGMALKHGHRQASTPVNQE